MTMAKQRRFTNRVLVALFAGRLALSIVVGDGAVSWSQAREPATRKELIEQIEEVAKLALVSRRRMKV